MNFRKVKSVGGRSHQVKLQVLEKHMRKHNARFLFIFLVESYLDILSLFLLLQGLLVEISYLVADVCLMQY
jgi:hypothetical protein